MNKPLPLHHTLARAEALAAVRYHVGVDGGGTGTRVKLADAAGRVLGQGEAGPSALGQGVAQAWRHILDALQQAAGQAGLSSVPLAECALGAGLSGANLLADAQDFIRTQPGFAAVLLENDGFTTVLGAHGGRPGVVVAAGTGTVGEVLRPDGSRGIASGWGWITGDEGSGAWLGLRAMGHAQQAMDGRVPVSQLALAVWEVAGRDRESILAWCAAAGQHGFASLAPRVLDAAEAGDKPAQALRMQAVVALEQLAHSLDPQEELPLALAGSIAKRLLAHFSGNIRARCVESQGDSADGALLLVGSALNDKTGTR
ncbi:BadF/BadG/BcrA/BcrD ATPase family protein [Pelomonas sp. BJYL3]|uniref:BadF/BadG/BcrA/BcrD ATPase family protein n=1 Tax=Pelomonas sp. BJYL3 TaxID=2976697 RepID=UPI0022B47912|nr:BadF/BadG/BcrA/BcrD ATPase family protein [Pelomonas sp. BJYL3]